MDPSASNAQLNLPPDETRGPALLAISWLCIAASVFFCACRLYTRIRITRNAAIDDAVVTISVLLFIVTVALNSVSVTHGLGRHVVHLQPDQVSYTLLLSAILQPIGIVSYCLPKLAVMMLILKIMGPKKHGVWFLYFIVTILAITSALSVIFLFAQCNPPSHFWNPKQPAKCWSPDVLMYTTIFAGSWSAFVDLSLALFPITIFWDLKMKRSRKFAISALMGFGIFAMICAIVKTTYLPQEETLDFTWNVYGLWVWTFIETAVVIICACIPTLPRLVLLLLGKDQQTTYYGPSGTIKHSGQSHSHTTASSYDKIFDNTAKQGTENDVEMQSRPQDNNINRTVDIHTQWTSV